LATPQHRRSTLYPMSISLAILDLDFADGWAETSDGLMLK